MNVDRPPSTYRTPTAPPVPLFKQAVRKISPRLRGRVHRFIYDTPGLSEVFSRYDGVMRIAHVDHETKLVMDGFPRSANSYARAAFLFANGIEIRISTHGHSHRFVQRGLQFGIPVIVLVREPGAAIASLLQYEPTEDLRSLVRAYLRYYRHILPIIDQVVVAPFDEVTADFGAVIARTNAKFGSNFVVYEKTPEAEAEVQIHVAAGTRNAVEDDRHDSVIPLPNFRTRVELHDLGPRTARLLRKAEALHAQVLERTNADR